MHCQMYQTTKRATMNTFKKAVRRQSKLRLAICGPSGAGKTYTALRLAYGLGTTRIAVIDTERGSASLYANEEVDGVKWEFDVLELTDYSPETFINAINSARDYDVLIIDSLTHAWDGIKTTAENASIRLKGGNVWAGWGVARPKERDLLNAMLTFPGHVIATMRAKTEWQIIDRKPVKIGLAPEQKAGIEYEFSIFIDIDHEHNAIVTKSRCAALTDQVVSRPGNDFANKILSWLNEGENMLDILTAKLNTLDEPVRLDFIARIKKKFGTDDVKILSNDNLLFLLKHIESIPALH